MNSFREEVREISHKTVREIAWYPLHIMGGPIILIYIFYFYFQITKSKFHSVPDLLYLIFPINEL